MITAKRYLEYSVILFPLLVDLIIACYTERVNDIRLKARLLSYLSLKILLLSINELVNLLYTNKPNKKASTKW